MPDIFSDYRNDPTFRPEILWNNGNVSAPPVLVSVLGLLPYGPFLGLGNLIGHISLGEAHVIELTDQAGEKVQLLDYECFAAVQESADAAIHILSKGQLTVSDVHQYWQDFDYHKRIQGSSTRARWLAGLGLDPNTYDGEQ